MNRILCQFGSVMIIGRFDFCLFILFYLLFVFCLTIFLLLRIFYTSTRENGLFHKTSCYTKNMKLPHSKKKFSDSSCLTDVSAKVVLSERNVEIKDLESKVKFLKNKIKELENENKTLQNVQFRQERELKKFKEGITDIPALLKSHKEEIKAYESTVSSIRKELKDCQKDLKLRNERLLIRKNQIDKLNSNLKQNEKLVQEYLSEIKVLTAEKKDLDEENKVLIGLNENLKNTNGDLCKQIKELDIKIQNISENLNKESDTNKNLKNELNELRKKYEKELNQVPNDENMQEQDCENQINCKTTDILSSEASNKSINYQESGMENMQNSTVAVLNEENLCSSKTVDKTKDVLIHTFKRSHHFCNTQLNNSDARLLDIGLSNIKLLPPLKTPSKGSFTSITSGFGNRECIHSSFDAKSNDMVKCTQSGVSTKEQQKKCTHTCEIEKSKGIANLSSDFITKGKSNIFDFSLNYINNDRQNLEIMKDTQSIRKNDNEKSLNTSFISTDAKRCGSYFSKPLKIHDYLLCENFKQDAQIVLEDNVLGKILEEENQSYFQESPKYGNKSLLCYVDGNDFECEFSANKCKGDKHKHSKTFLKQSKNTKSIIYPHFDDLSDQRNSEIQHELSWWDKW